MRQGRTHHFFEGWSGAPGARFAFAAAGGPAAGFGPAGGPGPKPGFGFGRAGSAADEPAAETDRRGRGPRGHAWYAAHGEHPHGGHSHGAWDPSRFFGRFPGGARFGRGPRARRGDVRAAVLALLAEEPMHGYQIMQELESRSQGMWRPSPGSVYPALQLLQDQGLVKAEDVEGRRVFSLTPEGEAAAAQAAGETPPWETGDADDDPRLKLRSSFFQLGAAVGQVGMAGSDDHVARSLEILAEARRKIYALLAEGD